MFFFHTKNKRPDGWRQRDHDVGLSSSLELPGWGPKLQRASGKLEDQLLTYWLPAPSLHRKPV